MRHKRPRRTKASAVGVALVMTAALGIVGAQPTRAAGTGDFFEPNTSPEPVSGGPTGVAAGDFNADGSTDIAAAVVDNAVNVLLGSGDGNFTAAATSPEATKGDGPDGIALGRFNADAFDDLAVANLKSGDVSILLGDGTGNFTEPTTSPEPTAPEGPKDIVVGRFNADGFDDLAVVHLGGDGDGSYVVILLGDGTGDFTRTRTSPELVGAVPYEIALGHFNDDAFADLAVPAGGGPTNTVTILLGHGTGDFSPAPTSPEGTEDGGLDQAVTVGRFNLDGFDDLAVTDFHNGITVLLGDGTGNFTEAPPSPSIADLSAWTLATGRFNNDAIDDVAAVNLVGDNVSILFGDGTGRFTEAATSPEATGDSPYELAVARLNADDSDDLAVANLGAKSVTILLNTPAGQVTGPPVASAAPSVSRPGGDDDPPGGDDDPPGDDTPPDTTIHFPFGEIRDRTPTYTFTSDDSLAIFECSVNSEDFIPCTTPFTTLPLKRGKTHTFAVRAIDQDGNIDATPAHDEFKVKKRKHRNR